jgi:hypothetical protein
MKSNAQIRKQIMTRWTNLGSKNWKNPECFRPLKGFWQDSPFLYVYVHK